MPVESLGPAAPELIVFMLGSCSGLAIAAGTLGGRQKGYC